MLKQDEYYNYIKSHLESDKELKDFFIYSDQALKDSDNNDFDFNAKAGDVIIFNDGGVHRGSKVLKHERVVVRYLFSTKI